MFKWWRNPRRIAVIIICITASAISLARWGAVRKTVTQAPPAQLTPTLTKEYVYVGGRLVAVEETVGATVAAPTGFLAAGQPGGQVSLTWATPISGTVDHYEVERTVSLTDVNPSQFNCATSPCADPVAVHGKAYLYRVRSVTTNGAKSAYSDRDLATTSIFADDPLNTNGTKTKIQALHFTELRDAVNAVRTTAGLPAFNWTDAAPQSGGAVRASHYNDLRAALSEALTKLGLPAPKSESASSGDTVTYKPVQELRDLMR